jgi:hypothetical protein
MQPIPYTAKEKGAHPWSCDTSKGDTQCGFMTPNDDDDNFLHCCWRAGHPEDLGHQAFYDGDYSGYEWVPVTEVSRRLSASVARFQLKASS